MTDPNVPPTTQEPQRAQSDLGQQVFEQSVSAERESIRREQSEGFDPSGIAALPPSAPPEPDPTIMDEALMRLMKSRADVTQFGLEDDRGNIIREPITDPDERIAEALGAMDRYLDSDTGRDEVLAWIGGGPMPKGYIPTDPRTLPQGIVESAETFNARRNAEDRAQAGREESPINAAFRDYVVDPLGNVFFNATQTGVDAATGVLNLFGAEEGGRPLQSPNVRERILGLAGDIGLPGGSTAAEMQAAAAGRSGGAEIAQGVGDLVGTVTGFGLTPGINLLGKAGGKAGKALFGPAGETVGHSVGVFSGYEALVAQPGERLEGAARGALSGALMGGAQQATSLALRRLFRVPISQLAKDEAAVMRKLQNWGKENRFFKEAHEAQNIYEKRLIDTYIAQGLPGAPKMAGRKIAAWAIKSGGTGTGLSAIDHQLHADLIDAAWNGDSTKWKDVSAAFTKNYIGGGILSAGGASKIVPLQRGTEIPETGRASRSVEARELETPEQRVERTRLPEESDQTGGGLEVRSTEAGTLPNWEPHGPRSQDIVTRPGAKRGKQMEATETQRAPKWSPPVSPELGRFGWESREAPRRRGRPRAGAEEPTEVKLDGTKHSFRVEGDIAIPSESLRTTLNLPERVPIAEMTQVVENASLLSALEGRLLFNGDTLVDAAGSTHARPGQGTQPGTLHRVSLGEVQQSPLQVPQQWKTVDAPQLAAKDALSPEQKAAVELLKTTLNQVELTPVERRLLSKSISVMDTVSEAKDPAVRETMEALPDLAAIAQSNPGSAVKALAESLTVKTPEIAMQGLERPETTEAREERFIEESTQDRLIREEAEQLQVEETIGARISEAVSRLRNTEESTAEPREAPPGSMGIVADPRVVAEEVHAALRDPVEMVKAGVAFPLQWFQRSQIKTLEDMGRSQEAELARQAVDATKRYRRNFDRAGMIELRRAKFLPSLTGELIPDGKGGYADVFAQAKDPGIRKYFGKPRQLTDAEQKIVDLHDAVTKQGAENARDAGATRLDGSEIPVGKGNVLVRQWSPEMRTEIRNGGGPRVEALADYLNRTQGVELDTARETILAPEALTRLDAVEVARSIDMIPIHLDVAGMRGPQRILESSPLRHAESLAHQNEHVMGFRSVVPRTTEKTETAGAIDARAPNLTGSPKLPEASESTQESTRTLEEPGLDRLPEEARAVVDRVLQESGVRAAQQTARTFRALNGMPVDPIGGILREPGQAGYRSQRLLGELLSIPRSAALTTAGFMNLAEPMANTSFFGSGTVLQSYGQVMRAIATGQAGSMHRQLVRDGWIADTKINRPLLDADTQMDVAINAVAKVNDALYSPVRIGQDFAEMVNANAARAGLMRMQEGRGNSNDRQALTALEFQPDAIDSILRGEGTPEQYARYKENIGGSLQGGKSLVSAERSDAGLSRNFNRFVWFTNFFQTRARLQVNLARDLANSRNPTETLGKLWGLTSFAAATAVSGATGNLIRKWLSGNEALADYIREGMPEDPVDAAQGMLQLWASGVLGGLGTPIASAFESAMGSGSRKEFAQSLLRTIGPANATMDFIDVAGHIAGVGVSPSYEGKDNAEALGQYLRKIMPAARIVHEGVFGLGAFAISSENPELRSATRSYYRWIRENRPDLAAQFDDPRNPAEEQVRWRNSIREVFDLVREGQSMDDETLVQALTNAELANMLKQERTPAGTTERTSELYKKARTNVASSFTRRMLLPDPANTTKFTEEEIASLFKHLGDKHVQTLTDYNAVLRAMARRVRRKSLRGDVIPQFREETGR